MANGQHKAQSNFEAFKVWKTKQTDDDFKLIIFRKQLNRTEIAKAVGCGKSALNQNPSIRKALRELENELRAKGTLPPHRLTNTKSKGKQQELDNYISDENISTLEIENIELRAKVKELEKELERFCELSQTISEIGFIVR